MDLMPNTITFVRTDENGNPEAMIISSADIDIYQLSDNIQAFALACKWHYDCIKEVFKDEE